MRVEDILKTNAPLPPRKKLLINLMLTSTEVSSRLSDALKSFDISMPQFNVLRILRGQKGKPANLSTIQDRMVNKMSNTTRLVDKLLEKNFVDRNICEQNRRKIEIFITPKGLELLNELDPVIEDLEKELTHNFSSEEIDQLNLLLEKLRK